MIKFKPEPEIKFIGSNLTEPSRASPNLKFDARNLRPRLYLVVDL
ncbi:hypothetical protein [Campylobacter showae]|nr:hypothetical protein [Campylobacter showae]